MREIKVSVATNKVGSETTRIIEVTDDATDEDIEIVAWETACEMILFGWEEVK